jgi:hypothetical protein
MTLVQMNLVVLLVSVVVMLVLFANAFFAGHPRAILYNIHPSSACAFWFFFSAMFLLVFTYLSISLARLGQPDGISPSRMAEMLEVDKAGPKVRC